MKILLKIVKRVTLSIALLYGFNIIMNAVNLFIPINIYTIGSLFLLGFPGLFLLVGLLII